MRISDWSSDVCSSELGQGPPEEIMNQSGAELAIRTRRAAFNRAIAEGDVPAISHVLGRDVVMVTGSDSAVVGRTSVVEGKSVSVRVDPGGRRMIHTTTKIKTEK